jgi:hypothetical protein
MKLKTIAATAASLAALVGLTYLLTTVALQPIGNDLSVIGKGKPVLVLVYENYSPTGGDALNRLSQVKNDYDSRLDFVVADLGVPEGRAFANRHQMVNGQAMFITQDSQPLWIRSIPADEQALRSHLDSSLTAVE